MRSFMSGAVLALLVSLTCTAFAQDNPPQTTAPPTAPPATATNNAAQQTADESAEQQAIRDAAASFQAAFNAGDAQAVAAHWTEDGELVDESGFLFSGRDEIAAAYEAFFAENQGVTLKLTVDRIKLINAETAIEDGESTLDPAPAGSPATARYTVVHVKRDGKWQMWTVRETTAAKPSNYDFLADLELMIGTWTSENNGVVFEATSQWRGDKNFIEQTFSSTQNGHTISSGKQIIGWDPQTQNVVSWTFNSDGAHAFGVWSPHETGWLIESTGTMADGTQTSAVNILSMVDADALMWRSVNRTAGEIPVPDTDELVLRRKSSTEQ